MGFRGPAMDAALILAIPRPVAAQLRLGHGHTPDERDLARELLNQTMGYVKNRLNQYQVRLTCRLPMCAERDAELDRVAPQRGPLTVYRFRTIYGQIIAATKGTIDASALNYSSTTRPKDEGDVILFDDSFPEPTEYCAVVLTPDGQRAEGTPASGQFNWPEGTPGDSSSSLDAAIAPITGSFVFLHGVTGSAQISKFNLP